MRNVAQKLKDSGKGVVFWGSHSDFQETCTFVSASKLSTADLSDYDPVAIALIPESKLAFFILSTYGEADPSDNAVDF
jgi:NADPH-ferrihemoprotein reductase